MDKYSIRFMRIDEYDALIELWQKAELDYKPKGRDTREHILNEIEQGTSAFLVMEHNGTLIGSVLATYDGRRGWINRVAVIPEHRGEGLAIKLVDAAEEWLENNGMEIIVCLVEPENIASQRLFEKLGYIRWDDLVYFSKRKHPDI